jgi:hypothetical protein
MWDPEYLTTLLASTACYGDSFTSCTPSEQDRVGEILCQVCANSSGVVKLVIIYCTFLRTVSLLFEQRSRTSLSDLLCNDSWYGTTVLPFVIAATGSKVCRQILCNECHAIR